MQCRSFTLVPCYLKLKPHCELHFPVAAMLVFVGDAPSTKVASINPETVGQSHAACLGLEALRFAPGIT